MSSTTKRVVLATVAGALAVPLLAQGSSAYALDRTGPGLHWEQTLSKSFVGPLQLAVRGKSIYVADSFRSILRKAGGPTLVQGPDPNNGGDIAGVAVNTDNGDIAYTSTLDESHAHTRLTLLRDGKPIRVSSLARYEKNTNPDKNTVYGLPDPNANKCVTDALTNAHIPVQYTGAVDSHPYAVAYLGHGSYAVADAGGNDIVRVGPTGYVTRIAVLPRQKFVATAAFAKANHLPDCVVGVTYYTEAVPTDVELGPGGSLLVTTLPGGPEGPGVPPRGSVYQIDPHGALSVLGTRFNSPVNLAVNGAGQIYVSELGANRVSTIDNGLPKPVYHVTAPAGLEARNGKVYLTTAPAATGAQGPGKLIVLGYDKA
jgi:hypothetical protein